MWCIVAPDGATTRCNHITARIWCSISGLRVREFDVCLVSFYIYIYMHFIMYVNRIQLNRAKMHDDGAVMGRALCVSSQSAHSGRFGGGKSCKLGLQWCAAR